MFRKRISIIFIINIIFLFILIDNSLALDVKDSYEKYIKSYNEFKDIVTKTDDLKVIETYAEKYQNALIEYQNLLKQNNENITNEIELKKDARGRIVEYSIDNSVAYSITSEINLKDTIKALHSTGARNKIDKIIQELQTIINTSHNKEDIITAKIELANAYAKFKKDYNKAVEILTDVVKSAKGVKLEEANRALTRAKYAKVKTELANIIKEKREIAMKKREELQKYSWFQNPIKKAKALNDYYKSLFEYRKAIAEHRAYRENGERDPNYVSYEFLSDIFGKRYEFGIEDTFDNTTIPVDDTYAIVRLLTDNNEAWYTRWSMLHKAKKSIDITYFIFSKDIFGKSLLGLLYKKASEGVKIRMMIDARGSFVMSRKLMGQDYLQKLLMYPNVQIKVFNPIHKALPETLSNIRNLLGSNHQKIVVVDGELAITGGRNIATEYFADINDAERVFNDTDVFIRGSEVALKMKEAFEEEFMSLNNFDVSKDLLGNFSKKEKELLIAYDLMDKWIKRNEIQNNIADKALIEEMFKNKHMRNYNEFNLEDKSHYVAVKVFSKTNYQSEKNDITDNLIAFIDACTNEIIIQNPYVIFTEKALAALKRANDRQVKIIIHTNSPISTDDILTQAFFLRDWQEIMKELKNLKIYVASKNMLHSKVFIFDRTVSVIGTYNMDYMSEQINSENVCAIKSKEFSEECRNRILEEIAKSKEYKIGINEKGEAFEISGPSSFTDKKMLFILKLLMKLNIVRPLI